MPSRTPGSGLPQRRGFATTVPVVDAFAIPRSSCEHHGLWAPVGVPRCHGTRFSEPRCRSQTSATEFDARTHPASCRSSPASEAFTSPPAPGRPGKDERVMPVALASSVRCRTVSLRAAICTRRLAPSRSTCVDEAGRGSEHSWKGDRALLTITRALLVEPRAPGSPVRLTTWPGRPGGSAHRPRLFSDATSRKVAPSRESRCLLSRQSPYTSEGLLPRARPDPCSVTRPPWRLCLGAGVPLLPPPDALF
jgi:hypothetical protein